MATRFRTIQVYPKDLPVLPRRRIGVLMLYPESDPQGQLRATAFRQGLEKLGWSVGRNVQIDFQWDFGDADWIKSAAAQLLKLAPDVILANGTPAARTMQQIHWSQDSQLWARICRVSILWATSRGQTVSGPLIPHATCRL